jgi:hypothetical protein
MVALYKKRLLIVTGHVQCVKGLVDEQTLYVVGKFHNIFCIYNAHFVPSILDLK